MVSLNSAEVNFIAYGWDEDNKAAMSLRRFFLFTDTINACPLCPLCPFRPLPDAASQEIAPDTRRA